MHEGDLLGRWTFDRLGFGEGGGFQVVELTFLHAFFLSNFTMTHVQHDDDLIFMLGGLCVFFLSFLEGHLGD